MITFFILWLILALLLSCFPFFLHTLRNVVLFALIVVLISILANHSFGVEFYPLFCCFVYLGAVTVSTLFVIHTFDWRREYARGGLFDKGIYWNSVFCFLLAFPITSIVASRVVNYFEVTYRNDDLPCHTPVDLGLNESLTRAGSDFYALGDYLYYENASLLIFLGFFLTAALLCAVETYKLVNDNPKNNI